MAPHPRTSAHQIAMLRATTVSAAVAMRQIGPRTASQELLREPLGRGELLAGPAAPSARPVGGSAAAAAHGGRAHRRRAPARAPPRRAPAGRTDRAARFWNASGARSAVQPAPCSPATCRPTPTTARARRRAWRATAGRCDRARPVRLESPRPPRRGSASMPAPSPRDAPRAGVAATTASAGRAPVAARPPTDAMPAGQAAPSPTDAMPAGPAASSDSGQRRALGRRRARSAPARRARRDRAGTRRRSGGRRRPSRGTGRASTGRADRPRRGRSAPPSHPPGRVRRRVTFPSRHRRTRQTQVTIPRSTGRERSPPLSISCSLRSLHLR